MIRIPKLAELPSRPRGFVLHWSGGRHLSNAVDRRAYNALVEWRGAEGARIIEGDHGLTSNLRLPLVSGRYAQHTGGFNSGRIGLAFCGEFNAENGLVEAQVLAGLRFVAECCLEWDLNPMRADTLCSHFEAWTIHGVRGTQNHVKPDIRRLRFRPTLTESQVGEWIRDTAAGYLLDLLAPRPRPPELAAAHRLVR
jgi:hypothetical protein